MKAIEGLQKRGGGSLPPSALAIHAVTVHIFSREIERRRKMSEKGIDYLRKKLNAHKTRVDMRYKQYAMQHDEQMVGITIPREIRRR